MKIYRIRQLLFSLLSGIVVLFTVSGFGNAFAAENNSSHKLRILLVGNSFSIDCSEYLPDVCESCGNSNITIGNCYIRGKTMQYEWNAVQKNAASFCYRISKSGSTWSAIQKKTLKSVLKSQAWDYVYFQQYSTLAGHKQSFYLSNGKNIFKLFQQYTKSVCPNKNVRVGFLMTWACKNNCTRSQYKQYYHGDQDTMYRSICSVTKSAIAPRADLIAYPGTAIQNARTRYGDTLNRDDRHLSLKTGRYLAAMSVAKASGIPLQNMKSFHGLSKSKRAALVQCVTDASKKPYSVTKQVWSAPTIKSLSKSGSRSVKLSWKKVSCSGYQIAYCTNSNFKNAKKTTVSSGKSSAVLSKLTKNKTYYVRIRAYQTVSGTKYYSKWSSTKSHSM